MRGRQTSPSGFFFALQVSGGCFVLRSDNHCRQDGHHGVSAVANDGEEADTAKPTHTRWEPASYCISTLQEGRGLRGAGDRIEQVLGCLLLFAGLVGQCIVSGIASWCICVVVFLRCLYKIPCAHVRAGRESTTAFLNGFQT